MATEYLRPQQAADSLGISRMTLYRWIKQGRVRVSESAHKNTLISSAEVERLWSEGALTRWAEGGVNNASSQPLENRIRLRNFFHKSNMSNVEYLRPKEAAKRLGVCRRTLDRYCATGALRCSRPSPRVVLISSAELARFYNANAQPVPVP
jgi:excisionase family DNA binding protein